MPTARPITILRAALAFGLTTAIVFGLAFRRREHPAHFADMVAMLGGAEALATIQQPNKVEAFRLGKDAPRGVAAYRTTGGPISVPTHLSADVATVLTDPRSYDWSKAVGCLPSYGVKLSFTRGADRVDVLLCFECDIVLFEHNGEPPGLEEFTPMRPVLVRAVKQLFPDDAEIQALMEEE